MQDTKLLEWLRSFIFFSQMPPVHTVFQAYLPEYLTSLNAAAPNYDARQRMSLLEGTYNL